MCPHDLLGKFRQAHIKMCSPLMHQQWELLILFLKVRNVFVFILLWQFSSFSNFRDLKIMSNNANHSCFKIAMGGPKLSYNLQDVDYGGP